MEYEWENDAEDKIYPLVSKINDKLPSGFGILGVAIENEETGEAFYMSLYENDGSVLLSDLMRNVLNSVQKFYQLTIKNRKV